MEALLRFNLNVFWSEEDGEWIVDIPDLEPCSASDATPEEAVREVQIAKELWLEVAKEDASKSPNPATALRYTRR